MDIESKQPLTDLTRKHTWRERPREGRQTKIRREMWSTTTVGPQTLSSSCTPHFYSTWPSYRSPSEQSTLAWWRETFLYKQVSSDSHIRLLTNPARRWSNSQSQKLSRVPSANRNGPPRYRHRSGRFVWTPSDICHPFVIGMRWHKKNPLLIIWWYMRRRDHVACNFRPKEKKGKCLISRAGGMDT